MTAVEYVRVRLRKFRGKQWRQFRANLRRAAMRTDRLARRNGWGPAKVKAYMDGDVIGYLNPGTIRFVRFRPWK